MQERASSSANQYLPYKFTGKELDPETGLYYFGARYYDAKVSRWISADPALSSGKYFPDPNDFDTEHDYFWYLENDKTHKMPGIGGVFNGINMDMYHYAGQNPVKLVDPDGEAFVYINKNAKTEYLAATRVANMVKSGYSFIPLIGNEIFKARCKIGGLYDLSDDSVMENILGKGFDAGGLFKGGFGKIMGRLGLAFNLVNFASSISIYKAEFVIDEMNVFDGMDLEFIAANADKVASQISEYIDAGEIQVSGDFMEGESINVQDDMNLLGKIRSQIENDYKQYQSTKDYE